MGAEIDGYSVAKLGTHLEHVFSPGKVVKLNTIFVRIVDLGAKLL